MFVPVTTVRRVCSGTCLIEQGDERALDCRLSSRRGDLCAEQIGNVEHVDYPLAEGCDMRGRDVEIELGEGRGQLVEQAGAVEPDNLDHRVAMRPLIIDGDRRLDREGTDAALEYSTLGYHIRQAQFAAQ